MQRLSVKGMAVAAGVLWGGAMLVVGLGATLSAGERGNYYGEDFLWIVSSIYPGYDGMPGIGQTLIGTGYALLDGAVCGAVFALLHNFAARLGGASREAAPPPGTEPGERPAGAAPGADPAERPSHVAEGPTPGP